MQKDKPRGFALRFVLYFLLTTPLPFLLLQATCRQSCCSCFLNSFILNCSVRNGPWSNFTSNSFLKQRFQYVDLLISLLPPATKLGQGNIFSSVCQEFCPRGGLPHCMLGYTTPSPRTRGRQPCPLPRTRHPQRSAGWEIRATSGRYASYWNAILF